MNDDNEAMNRLLRRQPTPGLIDPADAEVYLDASAFTASDGTVDEAARQGAIDRLIEAKPYLAGEPPPAAPPIVSVPGGPRGTPSSAASVDMNDVLRGRRVARRRDEDDEIRRARSERLGRFTGTGNDAA